jgi:hypothetical protein
MSKKLDEAERQWRREQAQRRFYAGFGLESTRPLSKRERVEAQRQYKIEQKQRKLMEDEIARREKLGQSTEQIAAELELWAPPVKPATEFLRKQLNEVRANDLQFDAKWKQVSLI